MTRRIFRDIMLAAVFVLLLASVLLVGTMYNVNENRIVATLRTEAEYIARALDVIEDDVTYFSGMNMPNRITLISPEGVVLYDSAADAAQLGSHAQRPEVMQALEQGTGISRRYSDTLSDMTVYYARRIAQGNVLRIADTHSSMVGVFIDVAPQLLIMLLIVTLSSMVIARQAARHIVAPMNSLNLDAPLENDIYEELAPLMSRLDRQHAQIRQQMKDLERAHSELSAIIENMREGMILLDRKNMVLSMNNSAAAIFDAAEEYRAGHDLTEVCREERVMEIVQAAQRGVSSNTLLENKQRTYRLFASPVLRQEKIRGVVLLILDVTERFAAEASRREFSANVSHELKTPLTSISGYAEIIRDGIAQAQDIPAFAGKIHSETGRLIALVNDIIELSRLDEKQGLGEKETVALLPMMRALKEEFSSLAKKKGVSLTLEGGESHVEGYPILLRELFRNLIDNAIKYTPAGGRIHLSIAHKNGRVVCRVTDNGIGIPPEHQPHVFERFYRVDKSHSRATGGTGLGLAIAKHAAEVHHAEITLQSVEGQGTTMMVRF